MSNYLGIATSTLLILKKDLKQKKQQKKTTKKHMKKGILLIGFISLLSKLSAQNCDTYKTQIASLQTENKVLISDNDYLKKVLDINKPIVEIEKDNTNFCITKVVGNKATKTVFITVLLETNDENKNYIDGAGNISITDLEGNEIEADYMKTESNTGDLVLKVPKKVLWAFTYKNAGDFTEPKIIKIFKWRFDSRVESKKFFPDYIKTSLEFRDLKVIWK